MDSSRLKNSARCLELDSLRKQTIGSWFYWFCCLINLLLMCLKNFLYVIKHSEILPIRHVCIELLNILSFKHHYFYLGISSNLIEKVKIFFICQLKELLFFWSHLKGSWHNSPSPLSILLYIFYLTTIH